MKIIWAGKKIFFSRFKKYCSSDDPPHQKDSQWHQGTTCISGERNIGRSGLEQLWSSASGSGGSGYEFDWYCWELGLIRMIKTDIKWTFQYNIFLKLEENKKIQTNVWFDQILVLGLVPAFPSSGCPVNRLKFMMTSMADMFSVVKCSFWPSSAQKLTFQNFRKN